MIQMRWIYTKANNRAKGGAIPCHAVPGTWQILQMRQRPDAMLRQDKFEYVWSDWEDVLLKAEKQ